MTHRRIHVTRAIAIALVAAIVVATPLAAQQSQPAKRPAEQASSGESATQRLLYALENQWAQGVVRRDAAAVRRLVAPRWIYSDESGTMNREEGIAAFTGGTDTVTAAGNDDMHAIVYGNTAIVTGILWMRGRGTAGAFEHRYRYTDTWMKLGGRWQCIASQDYLLPAKEGTR
ncbi:MAG TPA: nuclear transport factor 2 family protein [Gemmatimonadaceae bacterium]|nr:nuclear transport factor 2 family protein [Gemmatimonadaceae bacterium]